MKKREILVNKTDELVVRRTFFEYNVKFGLFRNQDTLKASAHESYVLSKKSFVTICLSNLISCAGDLSSDFGHSWHASCVRGTKALSLRIALKAHASFLKMNIQV